jgi:hypothetical protein
VRKILNDDTLDAEFRQSGYVRVPMLTGEQVASMLGEVARLRPDDNFAPSPGEPAHPTYHCSFLDSKVEYRRQAHELIAGVFAPFVEQYLNGYQIMNCNFYVKPPGTGEFVIHQNWPVLQDLGDTTVTVWCPLRDVVASTGALQLVEGSHKLLPHIESVTAPAFFKSFEQALIDKHLQPIPMQAGEGIIFDDGLIHWSARNESEAARIAIQILCTPKDAQPVFFFCDRNNPQRFELIASGNEFFLANSVTDLMTRQPNWRSLGFIPNRNRSLSEAEFCDLLARGDEIRQRVYSGEESWDCALQPEGAALAANGVGVARTSWWRRIRRKLLS